MPQDLPGFYFDAEKNRYFPIKGPIPGSSRNSSPASTSTTTQKSISKPNLVDKSCRRIRKKTAKLLQLRELCGDLIPCSRGKCSFQEEYQKIQASQPIVWKFQGTERIGDSAMELIHVNIDRPIGITGTDILFAASANGCLSFYVVGKVQQQFDYGIGCMPDRVWPLSIEERERFVELPGHLWRPSGASVNMSSNISCMKMHGKHSDSDGLPRQHLMITSLGSETSGGSVYTLNLGEPLDYDLSSLMLRRRIYKAASFNCTVWTADCNSDGSQAVVGTNLGAALVNLETGVPSWVFRCKSDVLSLQLDHPGKIVLCGLRNGAIVTVDTREKSEGLSARLARHQIPYASQGTSARQHIAVAYHLYAFIYLLLYDQCFLASSMDGSIRLYDHRLMQRGPVQFYEGNVNSHTRIQLGVDPYGRFFMSGGEDCNLRLWGIKSGELLYEDKFMSSVPSVVCWPGELPRMQDQSENDRDYVYGQEHGSGAWLGSEEGLFHVRWS
ncbi:uncharacterized protein LOC131313454 isoform X2 [Rhododendron vialii]|uniref:uncharacterized protein LOC131313454 isoform X2 n=1 Tax=Rhododendron vialii TaxID=182163 RepID=UPI0026604213|nr:uncharacterized protein LOC131313454 isoform X2 [Rhododendron vialii]